MEPPNLSPERFADALNTVSAAISQIGISLQPAVARAREAIETFGVSLHRATIAAYLNAGAPNGRTVQGMISWWRSNRHQPAWFRGAIPNSTVERAWVRRYQEMGLADHGGQVNSVPHPSQT